VRFVGDGVVYQLVFGERSGVDIEEEFVIERSLRISEEVMF